MADSSDLTTGQVADFFQAPEWRIRRIVDSMGVEIQRVGLYRVIPRSMLPAIGARLQGSNVVREAAQ